MWPTNAVEQQLTMPLKCKVKIFTSLLYTIRRLPQKASQFRLYTCNYFHMADQIQNCGQKGSENVPKTKLVQMSENAPLFFQNQNAKNTYEITVNPLSLFGQEGKESKPDILNTKKVGGNSTLKKKIKEKNHHNNIIVMKNIPSLSNLCV